MSWAVYQNNLINLNFHLQKRLEIFEKSADKQTKMPCPVPDRFKRLEMGHILECLFFLLQIIIRSLKGCTFKKVVKVVKVVYHFFYT